MENRQLKTVQGGRDTSHYQFAMIKVSLESPMCVPLDEYISRLPTNYSPCVIQYFVHPLWKNDRWNATYSTLHISVKTSTNKNNNYFINIPIDGVNEP